MGVGCLGCSHYLFHGGIRFAHSNIIPDCTRAKPGILQHHAHTASQRPPIHVHGIYGIQFDLAALRVVEPHEQVDKGSLSASGRADNCHPLTRLNRQIKVTDQRLGRIIGKGQIPNLHTTPNLSRMHGILRLWTPFRCFDEFKNSPGAGQCVL